MTPKKVIHIDRLELTFTATQTMVNNFADFKVKEHRRFNDIIVYREQSVHYQNEFSIWIKECRDGILVERLWGYMKYGSYNKNRPFIYILLENNILYDEQAFELRFHIEKLLGLKYKRVSKLDICVDFNYNVVKRFYSLFKDETFGLYVNGRLIKSMTERIKSIQHLAANNTRKRAFADHAPIMKNKDKSLCFTAYNKAKEIEESGKEYQRQKGFLRHYRFEVRCSNYKRLQTSLKNLGLSDDELYARLQDEGTLYALFKDILDRLIYFRRGKKKVDLLSEMSKPREKKQTGILNVLG